MLKDLECFTLEVLADDLQFSSETPLIGLIFLDFTILYFPLNQFVEEADFISYTESKRPFLSWVAHFGNHLPSQNNPRAT